MHKGFEALKCFKPFLLGATSSENDCEGKNWRTLNARDSKQGPPRSDAVVPLP
jgi:hypothetical protein